MINGKEAAELSNLIKGLQQKYGEEVTAIAQQLSDAVRDAASKGDYFIMTSVNPEHYDNLKKCLYELQFRVAPAVDPLEVQNQLGMRNKRMRITWG